MTSAEVDIMSLMWEDNSFSMFGDGSFVDDEKDLFDPKVPSLTNSCSSLPCPTVDSLPFQSDVSSNASHTFDSPLQELPGFPPSQTCELELMYLSPKKEVLPSKPNRSHFISLANNRIYITKRKQIPITVRVRASSYSAPQRLICRLLHQDSSSSPATSALRNDRNFQRMNGTVVIRTTSGGKDLPFSSDGKGIVCSNNFLSDCKLFVEFSKSPSDFKRQHFRLRFHTEEILAVPQSSDYENQSGLQHTTSPIFTLPIWITGHTNAKILHANNETVFTQSLDGRLRTGEGFQYNFDTVFGDSISLSWTEFKRRFQPLIIPPSGLPYPGKEDLFEFTFKFLLGERNDQVRKDQYNSLRHWIGDDSFWLVMLMEITNKAYVAKSWFHGRLSESESTSVLKIQQEGSFFVRLSCSMLRAFVFICKDKTSVKKHHLQFQCLPSGNGEGCYVKVKGKAATFRSLDEAIKQDISSIYTRGYPRANYSTFPVSLTTTTTTTATTTTKSTRNLKTSSKSSQAKSRTTSKAPPRSSSKSGSLSTADTHTYTSVRTTYPQVVPYSTHYSSVPLKRSQILPHDSQVYSSKAPTRKSTSTTKTVSTKRKRTTKSSSTQSRPTTYQIPASTVKGQPTVKSTATTPILSYARGVRVPIAPQGYVPVTQSHLLASAAYAARGLAPRMTTTRPVTTINSSTRLTSSAKPQNGVTPARGSTRGAIPKSNVYHGTLPTTNRVSTTYVPRTATAGSKTTTSAARAAGKATPRTVTATASRSTSATRTTTSTRPSATSTKKPVYATPASNATASPSTNVRSVVTTTIPTQKTTAISQPAPVTVRYQEVPTSPVVVAVAPRVNTVYQQQTPLLVPKTALVTTAPPAKKQRLL